MASRKKSRRPPHRAKSPTRGPTATVGKCAACGVRRTLFAVQPLAPDGDSNLCAACVSKQSRWGVNRAECQSCGAKRLCFHLDLGASAEPCCAACSQRIRADAQTAARSNPSRAHTRTAADDEWCAACGHEGRLHSIISGKGRARRGGRTDIDVDRQPTPAVASCDACGCPRGSYWVRAIDMLTAGLEMIRDGKVWSPPQTAARTPRGRSGSSTPEPSPPE